MTWAELLAAYDEHLAGLGRAPQTLELTGRWLARWAESCRRQEVEPAGVTPAQLAAFQRELAWTPNGHGGLLSSSSQYQALTMARQCLRWATRRGLLLIDPSLDLVLRAPLRPNLRLLTVAEVEQLLEAPDASTALGLRDRAVLATLYATGLRRGECHQLDLADLDLAQHQLVVRRGKGDKARVLPVLPCLAEPLARYLAQGRPALARRPQEPALFLDRRGDRLDLQVVGLVVKHHARRIGLGLVSPHRLRQAFATHLVDNGAEVVAIQALLGHARLGTTETYTRQAASGLAREHRRTHPRA